MSRASGARPDVAGERGSSQTREQPEAAPAGTPVAAASTTGLEPTERFPAAETTETLPAGEPTERFSAATAPATDPAATAEPAEPVAPDAAGAHSTSSAASQRPTKTRRVRLSMARVDPWSVMKISFLLSVAAGIAMVVATGVLWLVLSGLNVFNDLDRVIRDIQPATADPFSVMDYIGFVRVISLAVVIAVINVFLLTALSTLGAYIYNICSSLVGGVRMTLTDD